MIHYYVQLDNQQYGPYELQQLREFGLTPDILVYSTLSNEWKPAESYREIANFLTTVESVSPQTQDIYNASFYYKLSGNVYGPLSLSELSFLDINDNSLISIGNMQDWQLAGNIEGLMPTLQQLSANNAIDTGQSLQEDELREVIEDQEKDIIDLKEQVSRLLSQLEEETQKYQEIPIFDMSVDATEKYLNIEKEVDTMLLQLPIAKEESNSLYKKVFPTPDLEKAYYISEYKKNIGTIVNILNQVTTKSREAQSIYDNDLYLLDNSAASINTRAIYEQKKEEKKIVETVTAQIDRLSRNYVDNNDITVESLRQYLRTHQADIIEKYKNFKEEELDNISRKRREVKDTFTSVSRRIENKIQSVYQKNNDYFSSYFDQLYDTSKSEQTIWNTISSDNRNMMPSSSILFGYRQHEYNIFDKLVTISENCFIELLNNQHLIIRHNNATKPKVLDVVNTLIGRLMASTAPGRVIINMVDADEMDGTCDIFKSLNHNVFRILTRNEEIRKCFDEEDRNIGNIVQNMLLAPIRTLFEYNQNKENKQPYHLLVLEDFPVGINGESQMLLQKILKNGIRAGVNVIMLVNEDKIDLSDESRKAYNNCRMSELEKSCAVFDFTKEDSNLHFDILPDEYLHKIVQYVNTGVEIQEETVIPFGDYLIPEEEWWNRRSAKLIEVPFGISENKQIQRVKITQESGQNSAVVIGIPGSGKSVFLHTLICNAAVNYSPDELNMYLLDFSGVEFNTYALHNLPHARVIAPEAEREFGLSILKELVEEGTRRMNLCRDNHVSNIVDLKAKNPDIYIPRLLVIIDEFQKIFEIENDNISKEANSKIHNIIQEFRKFGINLILATQKLPPSYILPKDLIANRIVFKSSPNDFSALIQMNSGLKVPQLHTGECVYNSESGSPYDNKQVQTFLTTKRDYDGLLEKISKYEKRKNYEKKHRLLVFRGNDLPEFSERIVAPIHEASDKMPSEVGLYLGESIAIQETDVCVSLREESNNNLLIIGGEQDVAPKIAFYAACSAVAVHDEQSAKFYTFNFLRGDDPLMEDIDKVFYDLPNSTVLYKAADVLNILSLVKEEIDARRNDETALQSHIYLTFLAFHLARMFDQGGRRGNDVSECGALLDYILKNGPTVGVFTILHCDNYANLCRIGSPLSSFNYRVALQMSENESNKIVDSSIANKLYDIKRASSKYRAYFRDNSRNITTKFKPYK